MIRYNISNNYYYKDREYSFISGVTDALSNQTKELLLDFTIFWNLIECYIFNENFVNNYNRNSICDQVANDLYSSCREKIIYIIDLLDNYNSKYKFLDLQYASYGFIKSGLSYQEFIDIYNSDNMINKTKLLIYYCYRVRCNLFHGIKDVGELKNQNLLFFALNTLMSTILKEYDCVC